MLAFLPYMGSFKWEPLSPVRLRCCRNVRNVLFICNSRRLNFLFLYIYIENVLEPSLGFCKVGKAMKFHR